MNNERREDAVTSALEVLQGLRDVAVAELAKGPGIASPAWRRLHNAIAKALGEEALGEAAPVRGRQPVVMPPGYRHAIPAKNGAVPVRPDQTRALVAAPRAQARPEIAPSSPAAVEPNPAPDEGTPAEPNPEPDGTPAIGDVRARPDVAAELERIRNRVGS
jgi:hypothetical protein